MKQGNFACNIYYFFYSSEDIYSFKIILYEWVKTTIIFYDTESDK